MALTESPPIAGHTPQLSFDAPAVQFPAMADFHPAVRTWFERAFPLGPTAPQEQAWPSIAAGNDTLVAAPTGSGKTLSAFLVSIDQLYKRHDAGQLLANTAHENILNLLRSGPPWPTIGELPKT